MRSKAIIIEQKFLLLSKIGEGSFGKVYEAQDLVNRYTCAIKIVHKFP